MLFKGYFHYFCYGNEKCTALLVMSYSYWHLFIIKVVNEMASAAGMSCKVDPALVTALRAQKTCEYAPFIFAFQSKWINV